MYRGMKTASVISRLPTRGSSCICAIRRLGKREPRINSIGSAEISRSRWLSSASERPPNTTETSQNTRQATLESKSPSTARTTDISALVQEELPSSIKRLTAQFSRQLESELAAFEQRIVDKLSHSTYSGKGVDSISSHLPSSSKTSEGLTDGEDIVQIDVGGKIFATTKGTLRRFEGSYFEKMLTTSHEGTHFLDLNPLYFERILDYLRTGQISYNWLRSHELHSLKMAMLALQLPVPGPIWTWDNNFCGKWVTLTKFYTQAVRYPGMFTYSHGGSVKSHLLSGSGVLGTLPRTNFSVKLGDSAAIIGKDAKILIGLSPKETFHPNILDEKPIPAGWYFDAGQGRIHSSDHQVTAQKGSITPPALKNLEGTVVSVDYDKAARKIHIALDGRHHDTFHDIPENVGELYPTLYHRHILHCELTIVS